MVALLASRVAQNLDERPSNGASARNPERDIGAAWVWRNSCSPVPVLFIAVSLDHQHRNQKEETDENVLSYIPASKP